MKKIEQWVRPNIRQLKPYSSARNEFSGEASVWLDANEIPFNPPYNRYPDPLQNDLKEKLAKQRGVMPENIFLGVGSDEAIDLLYRIFCEPGRDNAVSIAAFRFSLVSAYWFGNSRPVNNGIFVPKLKLLLPLVISL